MCNCVKFRLADSNHCDEAKVLGNIILFTICHSRIRNYISQLETLTCPRQSPFGSNAPILIDKSVHYLEKHNFNITDKSKEWYWIPHPKLLDHWCHQWGLLGGLLYEKVGDARHLLSSRVQIKDSGLTLVQLYGVDDETSPLLPVKLSFRINSKK